MDNRDCVRKFLAIRLESAIELPGVLQQNDVCSENLFQGVEKLMAFDFRLCSIGHPAMEMSFSHGFLPISANRAYVHRLDEANLRIDTADGS